MRILAIESSCDESAAAILDTAGGLLAHEIFSQIELHRVFGGVVPELASRDHVRRLLPLVRSVMAEAKTQPEDLQGVAYTAGPGLIGALLTGASLARSLAYAWKVPALGVHHLEGHLLAPLLEPEPPPFPHVALLVSGGHTMLIEVREIGSYRLLGETRDDAAGEAYDKVAKLLGFGYPGGPVIDQLAPFGDSKAVRFTASKMKGNTLDFSFSGLKTAVLRWTEARDLSAEVRSRRDLLALKPSPAVDEWLAVTPKATMDLLASFQRTVVDEILRRTVTAAREIDARSVIISGGVACNAGLRAAAASADLDCPVRFPSFALSTDNAVMIAAAAFPKLRRGEFSDLAIPAYASLPLA